MARTKNAYRISTEVFILLWQNNLGAYTDEVVGDNGDWRKFCLTLFDRLFEDNLTYKYDFKPYSKGTKGSPKTGTLNEAAAYSFISERAYNKAMGLKRDRLKDVPGVKLPRGYKSRPGTRGSARKLDWDKLKAGFAQYE